MSAPFRLWRTIVLVFIAGFAVAKVSGDGVAILCTTIACAFLLSGFERREWIEMPLDRQMGDVLSRVCLALFVTFVV
ncbi:MAG TPA: hypothetical protein PKE27_00430 [Povalibacter sp.]|nr:hypothetical protein [Povalibacter sp.]